MQVISGQVRDSEGRPVAEARVSFAGGPVPLPDIAAMTGEDGSFQVAAPVPGEYSIVCTLPDGTSQLQDVEVEPGVEASVLFEN